MNKENRFCKKNRRFVVTENSGKRIMNSLEIQHCANPIEISHEKSDHGPRWQKTVGERTKMTIFTVCILEK